MFTNNKKYADKIKMLRIHGQYKKNYHKFIDWRTLRYNSTAVLLVKLKYFQNELKHRNTVASYYKKI